MHLGAQEGSRTGGGGDWKRKRFPKRGRAQLVGREVEAEFHWEQEKEDTPQSWSRLLNKWPVQAVACALWGGGGGC